MRHPCIKVIFYSALGALGGLGGLFSSAHCTGGACGSCYGCAWTGALILALAGIKRITKNGKGVDDHGVVKVGR